jgi:cytochrome c oxidase assembly factor CtaG
MDIAFNQLIAGSGCFSGSEVAGWTLDPMVLVPFLLGGLIYALGVVKLWRSAGMGRGASRVQVACFVGGWLLMGVALVSPLHQWSMELFWVHMVEHEIIMAAAAPLLVLARPLGPMLWAFPLKWRRRVADAAKTTAYLCGWDMLSRPLVATVLHGMAIWAWHIPALFEAALLSEPLHWLQHLTFLITALFFWWAMLETRTHKGAAVADLFFTAMHTGGLGVLIALAPQPIYPLQSLLSRHFGLDPLADQQLAGLIMWIPAGTVYVAAGLAIAWRWIGQSSRKAAPAPERQHARRAV